MEAGFPNSPIKRLERQIDRIRERQEILERMVEESARVAAEMSRLPEKMDQLALEISRFTGAVRQTHDHSRRSTEANDAMLSHLSAINERLRKLHAEMARMSRINSERGY